MLIDLKTHRVSLTLHLDIGGSFDSQHEKHWARMKEK